mmetsp:Transcript_101371/g.269526  ORF Transcript_101371/g.269526 Transcript_101371/m.269526 type:complete len:295 (-) Transcript_101371:127-1011(-)
MAKSTTLQDYLLGTLSQGRDSDVVLVVGAGVAETTINAHALILQRAEYFKTALSSACKEGLTQRIAISDVSPKSFQALIETLYTDELPDRVLDSREDLIEMRALCRRFLFPEAVTGQVLQALVEIACWGENVVSLLADAYERDLPDVVELCLSKIALPQVSMATLQVEFGRSSPSGSPSEFAPTLQSVAMARTAVAQKVAVELGRTPMPELHHVSSYRSHSGPVASVALILPRSRDGGSHSKISMRTKVDIQIGSKRMQSLLTDINKMHAFLISEMGVTAQMLLSSPAKVRRLS